MILRRLGLFPDPQSPPHSLFRRLRRHLPLWEGFLSSSKDERTTATTRLPSLHYAGYSTSVTNPPHMVQYNRVRGSSAKHATDGPKSRKLHYGEYVQTTHVSPPNPRIKSGFQRAAWEPFGTPFSPIFRRATKDGATGGPTEKRISVKT